MAYSSTYSSSTGRSTFTTTSTVTSRGDETSSSLSSVDLAVQSSSSDGSDGLAAALGGEAIALGEDTLAIGSVSAEMVDGDAGTTLEGSATMVAAGEASDGGAQAITDTFADVSDGAELVVVANETHTSSTQTGTGSTATSISTTQVTASNLESPGPDDGNVAGFDPVAEDEPTTTDASDSPDEGGSSSSDSDWDIDGNIAIAEFDVSAVGDDSFVSVDAFTLAIEDELSTSGIVVELGAG